MSSSNVSDGLSAAAGDSDDNGARHWVCDSESVPVSMLHPDHQSTPIKDKKYLPYSVSSSCENGCGMFNVLESHPTEVGRVSPEPQRIVDEGLRTTNDSVVTGQLQAPIIGYEILESCTKFTVRVVCMFLMHTCVLDVWLFVCCYE